MGDNQSYGELKWCVEDRANWKLGQPLCAKAEYRSSSI